MTNTKIIIWSFVMIAFVALLAVLIKVHDPSETTVYGDEYVDKYFSKDEIMEVDIQISESDLNYMFENAVERRPRTATVTVNGDTYPSVRIRPKGQSSLYKVLDRHDSNRYSFQINFREREGQTMAGLLRLNLNNRAYDPSYMREYLAYRIFEEMGVPVPAFSYAAVHINGEYFGFYLAVEEIDKPYLERHFGDYSGDLYRSLGHTLSYDENNLYRDLYTNMGVESRLKNPDWSGLAQMIKILNKGDNIENYLDVDMALRYLAVSTALPSFDNYQGLYAQNYYLYEQEGVYTILPWDQNYSFGTAGFDSGDSAHIAESVYIDEPTRGPVEAWPLVDKLLGNEEYRDTYYGYLEKLATHYLDDDYLEDEVDRIFDLIAERVWKDPTVFYSFESFVSHVYGPKSEGKLLGIPAIVEIAEAMSGSIQKQLSGEWPSTNEGRGMEDGLPLPETLKGDTALDDEALLRKFFREGGLTDELEEKAEERGFGLMLGHLDFKISPAQIQVMIVILAILLIVLITGFVLLRSFNRRRFTRSRH